MRNIKSSRLSFTINEDIRVPEVRLIDENAKQVGVVKTEDAVRKARKKELDLILIAPKAIPPVAKLMNINKFLYHEEKKLKEAKKGSRKGEVKDIQISLFIGKADYDRFVNRGKEFLDEGNQLRINILLKGREMAKRDLGIRKINEFIKDLGELNISKEPRLEGRVIRAVVSRKK
ncbi:MAG: translation initiation factor IF-3 [bacterium]